MRDNLLLAVRIPLASASACRRDVCQREFLRSGDRWSLPHLLSPIDLEDRTADRLLPRIRTHHWHHSIRLRTPRRSIPVQLLPRRIRRRGCILRLHWSVAKKRGRERRKQEPRAAKLQQAREVGLDLFLNCLSLLPLFALSLSPPHSLPSSSSL